MPGATTAHIDSFARDHLPPREQWPDFRFDLPELAYPERLNCAKVLLDEAVAEGHGDRYCGHYRYVWFIARADDMIIC